MQIKVITDTISINEVKKIAQDQYGDMVKAVVDVEQGVVALGGELHSDANEKLLEAGSEQKTYGV